MSMRRVEAERLLKAADGEWRTMIIVALRTGLRFGELIGLRWQDVDLVAGRIMVRQNIVKGIVGTPKSGHAREIPLGDDVLKALKSHPRTRRRLARRRSRSLSSGDRISSMRGERGEEPHANPRHPMLVRKFEAVWSALARVAKWLGDDLHIVLVDQISDAGLLDLRDLVSAFARSHEMPRVSRRYQPLDLVLLNRSGTSTCFSIQVSHRLSSA